MFFARYFDPSELLNLASSSVSGEIGGRLRLNPVVQILFLDLIYFPRKCGNAIENRAASTYISKFGEVVILLGLNDTDILAVCVVFNPSQR